MRSLLDLQKQLVPDLVEVLQQRYNVLRNVAISRTIGRRTLASNVGLTERVLRAEVDFLKEQGLLEIESYGTRVTEAGETLLEAMAPLIKELFGLPELEEKLRERFGLQQVVIVPGDCDVSASAKKELGRAGAAALRKYAAKDEVIAVTGGSTMADVAEALTTSAHLKGNLFVPARGGLGESVELQANTIASTMAKKTGGEYRLLHVPDHLAEEAYQSLIQDPQLLEIVQVIRHAGMVIHGIGEARVMARRRKIDEPSIRGLEASGALGEAFGYYFDRSGQVVNKMPTLGLRLEDLEHTDKVIAVAGGASKGPAIVAVLRHGLEDVLVVDEAAAQAVLALDE